MALVDGCWRQTIGEGLLTTMIVIDSLHWKQRDKPRSTRNGRSTFGKEICNLDPGAGMRKNGSQVQVNKMIHPQPSLFRSRKKDVAGVRTPIASRHGNTRIMYRLHTMAFSFSATNKDGWGRVDG
ncbi:predicted protein [Histoplasma mississippiense (nom. inval.)]|uniref:predicted protein n=1 Tax=Ajellomyces capsulatus (strain NAm1 / WU24) TaxID=2059318 RepID=UPI000157CC39|nr:predicted protein [Histoplasma mississippiense (nom. inval.)]EDN10546.1 predicted protein [Histoplasma mississippiense (nom. inval.)]